MCFISVHYIIHYTYIIIHYKYIINSLYASNMHANKQTVNGENWSLK